MTRKNIIYWKGIRAEFGLMFQIPKENTLYILDLKKDQKTLIHTFFCLKPLDIILVDSNLYVVGEFYNVKPFRVIKPENKFRYVIEGINISENDIIFAKEHIKNKLL